MSTPTTANFRGRFLVVPLSILAAVCLMCVAGCGGLAAQGKNAEGVRLFDQARYQESIEQFQQAINEDTNNADAYYNLASSYHRIGTLNASESDLKQAEQYYYMCHDRDPDHRECYRGLAVLLTEQDRGDEAFRLIEDWADREPALAAPKIELARLYEESGDIEQAKARLLEALAVDHEDPRALAALGKIREQTGDHIQALADYQRSLWHDRFQPEVVARAAALKSALNPTEMLTSGPGETRIVSGGSTITR